MEALCAGGLLELMKKLDIALLAYLLSEIETLLGLCSFAQAGGSDRPSAVPRISSLHATTLLWRRRTSKRIPLAIA